MKNGWKSVLSRQWAHRNLLFILKGNKFKWGEPHPLPHSPQRIPLNVLFRFLITCFDSSYLIAAYFLDYSFSFPLQQTLFQASSILFWVALFFLLPTRTEYPVLEKKAYHQSMATQKHFMSGSQFLSLITQIMNLMKQINNFDLNNNMHILGQNSQCLAISPFGKTF